MTNYTSHDTHPKIISRLTADDIFSSEPHPTAAEESVTYEEDVVIDTVFFIEPTTSEHVEPCVLPLSDLPLFQEMVSPSSVSRPSQKPTSKKKNQPRMSMEDIASSILPTVLPIAMEDTTTEGTAPVAERTPVVFDFSTDTPSLDFSEAPPPLKIDLPPQLPVEHVAPTAITPKPPEKQNKHTTPVNQQVVAQPSSLALWGLFCLFSTIPTGFIVTMNPIVNQAVFDSNIWFIYLVGVLLISILCLSPLFYGLTYIINKTTRSSIDLMLNKYILSKNIFSDFLHHL